MKLKIIIEMHDDIDYMVYLNWILIETVENVIDIPE